MSAVVQPQNLGPEFELGTTTANKITIAVDGTSVERNATTGTLSAAPPVWDNVAKTITFPSQDGATAQVIDLSQFTTDIYVNGGSFNPVTNNLTLVDVDGTTPDIVVDLSALLGVSADANNTLVNGTDGKPYFNSATLAACTDAFGTDIFRAFPV